MSKPMNYWLDLFTGRTWDEFRAAGSTITGFREGRAPVARKVESGDIFLCYLTGVQRWVGALEVLSRSDDTAAVWADDTFPIRFAVRPLVLLDAEHGVAMADLMGRVDFFRDSTDQGKFRGFIRGSPNRFREDGDGDLILDLLRRAEQDPTARPFDARKLQRRPYYIAQKRRGRRSQNVVVAVPDPEESVPMALPLAAPEDAATEAVRATTRHTEIQYQLLALGRELGLDVWVARNDRSRTWDGQTLGAMPGMLSRLPTQFNEATTRTIEFIDTLWLRGHTIVAAFEVECTTSVYSGLLRMSDLLALQPNIDIDLYLVAPDDRREKVQQEILRPTFALRDRPLNEICGFLPFGRLVETIAGLQRLQIISSVKPDFLKSIAEYFQTI